MQEENEQNPKVCPVFGVKSGAPPVGLGVLLILFAVVPMVAGIQPALPIPVTAILVLAGIVFIWMGIAR